MRRHKLWQLGLLTRIVISLGLLVFLFSRINPTDILAALQNLSVSVWLLAFLFHFTSQVLSSIRWWILGKALVSHRLWQTYLGFYFVGMFFNLFMPTAFGGDLLKVHFISRGGGKQFRAIYSVVGDRLFGLMALLLLGGGTVWLNPNLLPGQFVNLLSIVGAVILSGLAGMPLLFRLTKIIWPAVAQRLTSLLLLWEKPWTLISALGLSFFIQVLGIGAVALLGAGLGIEVPLAFYFAILPLIVILTVLPITFSGIGIREGAFIYFLGLKGILAKEALTLGLLFFSIQAAASLLGGLAYALGLHRRPPETPQGITT